MLVVVEAEIWSGVVSMDLMVVSTLIQTALSDCMECFVKATSNRTRVDV